MRQLWARFKRLYYPIDWPHSKSVILGETDFDKAIDCEKDVCADAPIEVPVANSYSRFDRRCPLADNIALIVLLMEVTYSGKLISWIWVHRNCLEIL